MSQTLKCVTEFWYHFFQNKLPNDITRKWEYELSKLENEEEDKRVTAEFFFDFLRSHVMSEEAIEKSTPNRSTHSRMSNWPRYKTRIKGTVGFHQQQH